MNNRAGDETAAIDAAAIVMRQRTVHHFFVGNAVVDKSRRSRWADQEFKIVRRTRNAGKPEEYRTKSFQ